MSELKTVLVLTVEENEDCLNADLTFPEKKATRGALLAATAKLFYMAVMEMKKTPHEMADICMTFAEMVQTGELDYHEDEGGEDG